MKIEVSVIIPNWNGENLLSKNLPKIKNVLSKEKYISEIIVVDDASTDNSLHLLESKFKGNIKVVVHANNMGFGKSCNDGVSVAKGRIIVLLNSDVIPHKGFLEPLMSHFKDRNVFSVSCNDGGRHAVGYYHQGLIYHKPASQTSIEACNSFWVSGGSAAFDIKKWNELGGFSPLFKPFYWEDTDLCYRALKRNWKIIWEPNSIVDHRHETTISNHFTREYINKVSLKNQVIFFYRNVSDIKLIINSLLWAMYHCIRNRNFFSAYINLVRQAPAIIRFRMKEQRTLNDIDILNLAR